MDAVGRLPSGRPHRRFGNDPRTVPRRCGLGLREGLGHVAGGLLGDPVRPSGDRRRAVLPRGGGCHRAPSVPGPRAGPVVNHLILYEVSKRFGGVRAVDEVSLEFAVRKTHAIIGPNGAGKTTLFNLISGSLPLSGGRIQLGDVQNFARLRPHQRALCGVVRTFQITSLFPALTVREHLALSSRSALGLNGRLTDRGHGAEIERRSHDILQQLRLGTIADRVVKELSHGEQRKVEIALGLALDPQFLLLDEPTAGMSKAESREMIVSLQNLRESQPEIGIVI
ncbi:MAG: ATP-binding cassette domain-containing protein, partial [Solirubrobacterales bacterium]|nr:ATP-binding cassette domain-containing protein [Solirubrobacterales bacterium]